MYIHIHTYTYIYTHIHIHIYIHIKINMGLCPKLGFSGHHRINKSTFVNNYSAIIYKNSLKYKYL